MNEMPIIEYVKILTVSTPYHKKKTTVKKQKVKYVNRSFQFNIVLDKPTALVSIRKLKQPQSTHIGEDG